MRHDPAQKRFEMISIAEGRAGIESIAKGFEIEGRIDGIESKQFIATNIWEWSKFAEEAQREEIEQLINRYNNIVEEKETDPSLKIQI